VERLAAITLLPLLLAGCDRLFDELSRVLWGVETTVTIIAAAPMKVSPAPTRFDLPEPAKVVGTVAHVCLSLRGDLPLGSPEVMTAEFKNLMRGASVTVVATTTEGKTVTLSKPSQAWSKSGKIEKRDELAACVRAPEAVEALPVGTKISRIEVSATTPVDVRGLYWESSNAWDRGGKGSQGT